MKEDDVRTLYALLLELNRQAFAGGEYNTAYHILAAALHCGESVGEPPQFELIERVAQEQLEWIDANAPSYEHSSASAAKRGHLSLLAMVATQARTMAAIARRHSRAVAKGG